MSVLCMVLSACSSDGPSLGAETAPTPTQQSAIASTATDLQLLSKASIQGEAAGGAAINFALTAQALLATSTTARALPGLSDATRVVTGIAAGPSQLTPDGCEVIGASSIVWNHCMDGNDAMIDGSLSWSPGHVDVDLHVTAASAQVQFDYAFTGSMSISDSAIQGDMMLAFSFSSGGNSSSETIRSQIDVQLMDGCIFDGTLTVTETGTGGGSRSGAVQVVWSGCGVFRVRNG